MIDTDSDASGSGSFTLSSGKTMHMIGTDLMVTAWDISLAGEIHLEQGEECICAAHVSVLHMLQAS